MIRLWNTLSLLVANTALLMCALSLGADSAPVSLDSARPSFETDVVPIFERHCFGCHGQQMRKAGLDLSSAEGLTAGSEAGSIFSAGQPDGSLLWQLVQGGQMPPEGSRALTAVEKKVIHDWILGGARFEQTPSAHQAVTQHEIIPLLLLRCATCHGARRQEGGLDVRSKAALLRGGKSGPAVVPGEPGESLLIQRIRSEQMPPRRELVAASVKPMQPAELQRLEAWISGGMPQAEPVLGESLPGAAPQLRDQDREFWSFQRPRRAQLPLSRPRSEVGNPVDAFVLDKLLAQGLAPSPPADRVTLLRRVCFDLTGLPPTPEAVASFLEDDDPLAYERMVDRLLASPRYGERWGRHWLDVAGYADSEGAQNEDRVRAHMWRYRDYVIQAFNADKPYDRFLHEQLAGDELADYTAAERIDQQLYDNLVATGFLRTAPDRTFADITNFVPDRLEVVAEEMQVFGSAVLGLTIQCARCHSHKFDPFSQADYYRLTAVFKDALDEHDWLKPAERSLPHVTCEERQTWETHEQQLNDQVAALQNELKSCTQPEQKKKLQQRIERLEALRRPEPRIRALWSRGEPSPSYVLNRGNYLTPGVPVGPGVPAVLNDRAAPFEVAPIAQRQVTGRRRALAYWLTNTETPVAGLVARVMVNRIWLHHFGQALVATPGNFGNMGARPTHPELLDWLALEFMRSDWNIKSLHRLLLNSRTYRQSSALDSTSLRSDPQGELLSRMPLRRMEAEVLRDSLLFVADRLDLAQFGEPDEVDARDDGLVLTRGPGDRWRRSIYVLQRRTKMPTILEAFDYPQMGPNCLQRGESLVAPQALHLLNNEMVYRLAQHFAERVRREVGDQPQRQVQRAHLIAWSRLPQPEEFELGVRTLRRLTRTWSVEPDAGDPAARALTNYCHALVNSAAFLYVE